MARQKRVNDGGQVIEVDNVYYYQLDTGSLKNMPLTKNYIEISGKSLLALDSGELEDKQNLEETKYLMPFILGGISVTNLWLVESCMRPI